jgi:hypothetical protein
MVLRTTFALAAASVLVLVCGCGKSSSTHEAPLPPVERIVFSDGIQVHLATFDGSHLVTLSTAQIPPAGLLAGHTIFGLMKHPTKPWLYVSSLNECWSAGPWCWGNARIDRFDVSRSSIAWVAQEFDYVETVTTLAPCTTDYSSDPGVNNYCAPVNGTFSVDGSRLYMKNDDYDDLEIFDVAPNGALALQHVSDDSSVYLHGIAVDPSGVGTYVYNGTTVFGVSGDVGQVVTSGNGGNYTRVFSTPGGRRLLTTLDTNQVGMFDLSDLAAPVLIDSVTLASNQARSAALNDAMNRVAIAGRNGLRTYGWDGSTFAPEGSFDPHVGTTNIEGRSVTFFSGGTRAAMSFFVKDSAAPSGFSGGVSVVGIDPTGAITTIQTVKLVGSSRVIQALEL